MANMNQPAAKRYGALALMAYHVFFDLSRVCSLCLFCASFSRHAHSSGMLAAERHDRCDAISHRVCRSSRLRLFLLFLARVSHPRRVCVYHHLCAYLFASRTLLLHSAAVGGVHHFLHTCTIICTHHTSALTFGCTSLPAHTCTSALFLTHVSAATLSFTLTAHCTVEVVLLFITHLSFVNLSAYG